MSDDNDIKRRRAMKEFHEEQERRRADRALAPWPRDEHGNVMTHQAMTVLARMFPSLAKVPGLEPWDPMALLTWACGPAPTGGGVYAAAFMLALWNVDTDWVEEAKREGLEPPERIGRFNVVAAMSTWDHHHREAFMAWVRWPFWP